MVQIETPLITAETMLDAALENLLLLPRVMRDLAQANAEQQQLQQQIIAAQERTIRELSVPLIPITDAILVLPLVGALDPRRSAMLMETVLAKISSAAISVLLIDITGVPVVDTGVAHQLLQMARAVELLGAQVILVGISPEIAQTIVQLGVDLSSIVHSQHRADRLEYVLAAGKRSRDSGARLPRGRLRQLRYSRQDRCGPAILTRPAKPKNGIMFAIRPMLGITTR